ncbi:nipblb [Symbiodinium sp. CCMP2456]|nr:nipblb [Symbiodinium sp. CCMP2456]
MIKVGEVFEATEAVPPSDSTGLGYLRVGDRGWVFDMGIAGPWIGVPVVAAVTGPSAMKYAQILRNPVQYAEYQAALGEEIFPNEVEINRKDHQTKGPDPAAFAETVALGKTAGDKANWPCDCKDIEDTGLLTEDEQQSFESLCQDEEERNLVLSSLRAAAGEAFRKLVVPRWMKLAQRAALTGTPQCLLDRLARARARLRKGERGHSRFPCNAGLEGGCACSADGSAFALASPIRPGL